VNGAAKIFDAAEAKLDAGNSHRKEPHAKDEDARARLAALQAQKTTSEADLAAKKAVYVPLLNQMAPYENALKAARSKASSLKSAISRDESLISNGKEQIRAYQNERSGLESRLPGLQKRGRSVSPCL
jgi:chromosome segregation ATPase